jgi:uncharacterized phage protein (TIGR01671 family)
MNREIKFRVWNGNIMINFADFEFTNTGGFWGGNREVWAMQAFFGIGKGSGGGYWHSDFAEDVKLELMQFTGLKDKNGKEIYEGDILEYKNELGKQMFHKVFRVNGGLVINSHCDDFYRDTTPFYEACADMQTSQWMELCDVIGNIYENPIQKN